MNDQKQELATVADPPAIRALRENLQRQSARFENLLPSIMRPEELFSIAVAAVSKTPRLLECTQESLVKSLTDAARLGLRPDGLLSEGWLVPRWNRSLRRYEAQFQTGYRGLEMLMRRAGARKVETRIVYEGEPFRVTYGFAPNIEHEPRFDIERTDERITHFYAWAVQGNGEIVFEVMTAAEVWKIRDTHGPRDKDGKLTGPWITDAPEMGRKTALRRLAKHAELSTEAKEILGSEDADLDVKIEPIEPKALPETKRSKGSDRLRKRLTSKEPEPAKEPAAEEKQDAEEEPTEPAAEEPTEDQADGSREADGAADDEAGPDAEAVDGEYVETKAGHKADGETGEIVEAAADDEPEELSEDELMAAITELTGGEEIAPDEPADDEPAPEPEGEIADGLYIGAVTFPAAGEKYDGKLKTYPDGKQRTYFGLKWPGGELLVVAVDDVAKSLFKSNRFTLADGQRVKVAGKKHEPKSGAFKGRTLLDAGAIETWAPKK